MKKKLFAILFLALLSFGCTADVLGRIKGFDVLQIIQSQPVGEAITKARNIGRVLATIEALICLLYTSPSPRDRQKSRMPSSA